MVLVSFYLSIITFTVNQIHSSKERHGMAKRIKKKKKIQEICCLQDTHFNLKTYNENGGLERDISSK